MRKQTSAKLYQQYLILYGKILLLNVPHNATLPILFPWQHTGFQTSPILEVFLANFVVPSSHLLMVAHMHDPAKV